MEGIEHYLKLDEGLISRKIFFDPEIYQLELERIFARCWLFLGHESPYPEARRLHDVLHGRGPRSSSAAATTGRFARSSTPVATGA